jgi:hypothetical protein
MSSVPISIQGTDVWVEVEMFHPGLGQDTVKRDYFAVRDNQDSAH